MKYTHTAKLFRVKKSNNTRNHDKYVRVLSYLLIGKGALFSQQHPMQEQRSRENTERGRENAGTGESQMNISHALGTELIHRPRGIYSTPFFFLFFSGLVGESEISRPLGIDFCFAKLTSFPHLLLMRCDVLMDRSIEVLFYSLFSRILW